MIGALAAGWDEVFGIDNDPQSVEWAEKRLSAWKELKGGLG
jgi:ribosomal protein L11 methylase PrmA